MITGLNHITLSISNLERSLAMYRDVLGCTVAKLTARGAYLEAGDLWLALEVDPDVRSGPLPEYSHIAFSVAAEDFETLEARIQESGAEIFKENVSEGASLYFVDPDGHKLEIHVGDLASRLAS